MKNSLRARTTDSEWAWPECTDASTALLAALRESVMSMICLTSKEVALATPSLIAKSSASKAVARPAGALDDDTCTLRQDRLTSFCKGRMLDMLRPVP